MDQLDQLGRLFPEAGLIPPTAEVFLKIRAIEESVQGQREELEAILSDLEGRHREEWSLGREYSWTDFKECAKFPDHDGSQFTDPNSLLKIHRSRCEAVAQIFSDCRDVSLEDGGVKAFERAKYKVDRRHQSGKPDYCPDLTRMRLVVSGLAGLENAYDRLLIGMPFDQIGNFNHYGANTRKNYQLSFRAVLTNWSVLNPENSHDQISTEVQLITERVRAIVELDHPFNVAGTLHYPDQKAKDYVHGLMLKASILDFRERFPGP